mmetsp:Transcript_100178/g.299012  ORF Transcript_100178/g.299012 Transcript_100178/m.299012 type:complete len:283 (-) Transcript_100178:732-1580(-)
MDGQVQGAQVDLAQHHQALVDVLGFEQGLHLLLGERLPRLLVLREPLQDGLVEAPVLQHLRGRLHEVPRALGEAGLVRVALRAEAVHDVAELVEEGDDVVVAEQRRAAVGRGPREVAEHAVHRGLALRGALEEVEDGRMAVLAVPRVQVQVEVAYAPAALLVVHDEEARLRVPAVELLDLREPQTQELLVDVQSALHHDRQGEVLPDLLVVDAVLALQEEGVVEAGVPRLQLHRVGPSLGQFAPLLQVLRLQEPQPLLVNGRSWNRLVADAAQEGVDPVGRS